MEDGESPWIGGRLGSDIGAHYNHRPRALLISSMNPKWCLRSPALVSRQFISEECHTLNRDVLRWGKNIGLAKTRTKKRAGVAVYNRASSLETLVIFARNTDQIASIAGFGFGCKFIL
ncbi:hypothetical protein LOK49_LG04G00206 [Camellia lanceoleosa]|uniref:Uncharacterized protein n=1 Tax=Camellia lanceoleosa TaxID=1840588 RepID=A0ACC0I2D9_9ERIC|nr:hypothetical protein LOK49_LG04G00206 [Camellia lanceoleosa]